MTAQKNWRRLLATATTGLLVASGLAIAPAVANAAPGDGVVADATLDWGVKSSFRNYITSPMAKGTVTNLGATTGSGPYSWSGGTGTANLDGSGVDVAFGENDGVHFQGHASGENYILDLALTQPQIKVTSPTTAELYLDAEGRNFEDTSTVGEWYSYDNVHFADLTLPTPSASNGIYTWTEASARFTAEGATSFAGYYSEGDALDPITFSAPIAAVPATETTTTISASASTVTEGDSVEFTATVAPAEAEGSVTFSFHGEEGAAEISPAISVENGSAKFSTNTLPLGTNAIDAKFTPTDDAAFTASSTTTSAAVVVKAETPVPVADPKITVTPSKDLDPAVENVITVSGTGFVGAGAAQGAYVLFGEKSVWSGGSATPSDGWIKLAWVRASSIVDGAFEQKLTIPAGTLKPGTEYQVATSAAHALSVTDRSLDTFTPVSVAKPAPVADPKVMVTPSADLDPAVENVVTVEGTGFVGAGAAQGAYVLFGEKSVWSGGSATPSDGWIKLAWVRTSSIVDGAFEQQLTIPAGTLKPGTEYQVATSAAHALSVTDRSLDTFTPVTVQAPVEPSITIDGEKPSAAQVRQGEPIEFSAGPFAEGSTFEVWVNPAPSLETRAGGEGDAEATGAEPLKIGDATVDSSGTAALTWKVPADFAAGDYVVAFEGTNVEAYLEADFTVSQYVISTTTLTSSAGVGGSPNGVEFVATISPETATGEVTFTKNGTTIATVPVANGTASTTTDLAVGSNEIVATFVSSDATVSDSVSDALLIEVTGSGTGSGGGAADGGADGSGAAGPGANGTGNGSGTGTIESVVSNPAAGAKGLASTGGEGFAGLLAGGALALLLGAGLMVARRRVAAN